MKTNPNDSTSPIVVALATDSRLEQVGLTKREYFAALVLGHLVHSSLTDETTEAALLQASTTNGKTIPEMHATMAVNLADHLIAKLNTTAQEQK